MVTVNQNPTVSVNNATRCSSDGAVTLTATPSPAGNYSYLWSNGATTQSIMVSAAGSYSVTVTNTTTGCTGSGSGMVTVNQNPTVSVNNATRCSSDGAV